jgi:hypothetical protein
MTSPSWPVRINAPRPRIVVASVLSLLQPVPSTSDLERDYPMVMAVSNSLGPRLETLPGLIGVLDDRSDHGHVVVNKDLVRRVECRVALGSKILLQVKVVNPSEPMIINLGVHLVACENQGLERVDTVSV